MLVFAIFKKKFFERFKKSFSKQKPPGELEKTEKRQRESFIAF